MRSKSTELMNQIIDFVDKTYLETGRTPTYREIANELNITSACVSNYIKEMVKRDMIEALFNRGDYIRQVNDIEYRTRCPFCGDSQKNFNTGHLYIRINVEDNFPIVYNCFKCNESGIVGSEFLNVMDIK